MALSVTDNFILFGYETENGYGAQIMLQHGNGIAAITARKKREGTWGAWGENPV